MRGDYLQREIIEGRMEGKRGRENPDRSSWTLWWTMVSGNSKKKHTNKGYLLIFFSSAHF